MPATSRLFRWSSRDAWLVGAALVQGALTVIVLGRLAPSGASGVLAAAALFALSIVWGSNTVSHNHLHNPLFHSRTLNRVFALYLSVLLAVPQSIWKQRHLGHHAGEQRRRNAGLPSGAGIELCCIALVWGVACGSSVRVLAAAALGYALGMALCRMQGNLEHARESRPGGGVSHYGWLYNFCWFNDGHHAEHHRWPALHWSRLPERRVFVDAVESRHPPLLRWLDGAWALLNRVQGVLLAALERLPLAFGWVASFMLTTHERAFRTVLARLDAPPRTIAIIGGGLFPRTLIVLRRLVPSSRIVVIDRSAENVERAHRVLDRLGVDRARVEFRVESFDPGVHFGFDLVVCPLGFVGDRQLLNRVRGVVVSHDWLLGPRADQSVTISWLLFKRLSLHLPRQVRRTTEPALLGEAA